MKIASILISLLLLTAPLKAEVENIANSNINHIHDENCKHKVDEFDEFDEFDESSDSSNQKTDINDKNKDSLLMTDKAIFGLSITGIAALGYLIHNYNPGIINKVALLGAATLAPILGWFWNTNCGGGGQGFCPHCKIQQALTGEQ